MIFSMPRFRRQLKDAKSGAEREEAALVRAEQLCERAEALHREATAEAAGLLAEARLEAARLLRQVLDVVDDNVARADAARAEAEQLLDEALAIRARMATAPEDGFRLAVDPDRMLDLKILSELSR